MKAAIEKFLHYLRYERNASGHTLRSYECDLLQFLAYLTPPGSKPVGLAEVDHRLIREFMGHLHDLRLERSSIARKLAALRSFFKFCVREGVLTQNPGRLVATPKLPKRVPAVLTAEEMNNFLDQLARMSLTAERAGAARATPEGTRARRRRPGMTEEEARRAIRRDRAILELLYASGLRVSELVGLDLADLDRAEQMLRVRGKGRKERIVPYGSKAEAALQAYWPVRAELLRKAGSRSSSGRPPLRRRGSLPCATVRCALASRPPALPQPSTRTARCAPCGPCRARAASARRDPCRRGRGP